MDVVDAGELGEVSAVAATRCSAAPAPPPPRRARQLHPVWAWMALLLCCTSCVFAADIGGTVRIDLQLVSVDGSPMTDVEVRLVADGFYGFRGDGTREDMVKIGNGSEWLHGRTNERGHIGSSAEVIHGAGLWVVPPLGVWPKFPPAPALRLAVPAVTPHWLRLEPDESRVRLCDGKGRELAGDFAGLAVIDYLETRRSKADGGSVTTAVIQVRFLQAKAN